MQPTSIMMEIKRFLQLNPIVSANSNEDGRVNSNYDEAKIILSLQEKFSDKVIVKLPPRATGDFAVMDPETEIDGFTTVNIKSTTKGFDNAFSKKGLLLSFTDLKYEEINNAKLTWSTLYKLLTTKKKFINRDYWYFVFNKNNMRDFRIKGMQDITHWKCNPTNMLQIDWKNEWDAINNKTVEDAYKEIHHGIKVCMAKDMINKLPFLFENTNNDNIKKHLQGVVNGNIQ